MQNLARSNSSKINDKEKDYLDIFGPIFTFFINSLSKVFQAKPELMLLCKIRQGTVTNGETYDIEVCLGLQNHGKQVAKLPSLSIQSKNDFLVSWNDDSNSWKKTQQRHSQYHAFYESTSKTIPPNHALWLCYSKFPIHYQRGLSGSRDAFKLDLHIEYGCDCSEYKQERLTIPKDHFENFVTYLHANFHQEKDYQKSFSVETFLEQFSPPSHIK